MTTALFLGLLVISCVWGFQIDQEKEDAPHSIARVWSHEVIDAGTRSGAGPTVAARNMFLAAVCWQVLVNYIGNAGFLYF